MDKQYEFDVAISFAGEDRRIAEELASILHKAGIEVFYDSWNQHTLWGKDLYQHLQSVYKEQAKYCVILVSKHYVTKNWPRHELHQAQARAIEENREYILPLRIDDTIVPGVNHTIGYVDLRQHRIEQVAKLLLSKLGHDIDEEELDRISWNGDMTVYNGVEMASYWPRQIERAQQEEYLEFSFRRIRYGDEGDDWGDSNIPCHDCGVVKGQYHVPGCDMERCPNCRGQLLSCSCGDYPDDDDDG
jgi:hypothetical protein